MRALRLRLEVQMLFKWLRIDSPEESWRLASGANRVESQHCLDTLGIGSRLVYRDNEWQASSPIT